MTITPERLAELIEVYDQQAFRGDIVLALRELLALRAAGEWRPIEEAPMDGTRVLVYSDEACEQEKIFAARFLHPGDEAGLMGWWESLDTEEPVDVEPTHWRPLPPPPERKRDERDTEVSLPLIASNMAAALRRVYSYRDRLPTTVGDDVCLSLALYDTYIAERSIVQSTAGAAEQMIDGMERK